MNPIVYTNTSTQNARFYFNITNTGSSLDYITILRSQMDISGPLGSGEALGVSSPEFGRSLGPGVTGQMMVIVQWTGLQNSPAGAVQLGNYTISVPFKSEASGSIETVKVRVVANKDTGEYEPDTNINITPAEHSVGNVSVTQYSIPDSIWTLGGSSNLNVMATAPMNHGGGATKGAGTGEITTGGSFYGIVNGKVSWNYTFPSPSPFVTASNASQWQATDTYISVSNDGKYAAGMDWNGWLYLFNATSGKVLWSTNRSQDVNPLYPPNSKLGVGFLTSGATAFSSDDRLVAAAGTDGDLVMFNTTTGQARWSKPFSAEIRALAFTSDGKLAVGSGDWHLYLLNATTGATVWKANDYFWPFFFIAINQNSSLIGSGGKDSEFNVWNLSTGQLKFHENYTGASVGFVSGGGIANNGDFMASMWSGGNGVFYYNKYGQLLWKHSINGAVAAIAQDGNYTLVSGYNPVSNENYIYLLDNTGSVIWNYTPNTQTSCLSTISPFPRVQPKFVRLYESPNHRTLIGAVACIGGTVFYLKIPVYNTPPSTPNPNNNGGLGFGNGNAQPQPPLPNGGKLNGSNGTLPPCTQNCAAGGSVNTTNSTRPPQPNGAGNGNLPPCTQHCAVGGSSGTTTPTPGNATAVNGQPTAPSTMAPAGPQPTVQPNTTEQTTIAQNSSGTQSQPSIWNQIVNFLENLFKGL
ncbi:MAG: PQQ-binding-like beta-propeller repeat protein [Candidatus Micrarchaeota archaeon]|nr:PQQ-binding-like beta-propeller repeat protein [Candidatus Micrarchaeota archaeon]